jgi:hypothetical protein
MRSIEQWLSPVIARILLLGVLGTAACDGSTIDSPGTDSGSRSPNGADSGTPSGEGGLADSASPVVDTGSDDASSAPHDATGPLDAVAHDGAGGSGCGAGTTFCNSSCGICLLTGAQCHIDSCGNGNAGEICGSVRCGTGTHCVGSECLPQ